MTAPVTEAPPPVHGAPASTSAGEAAAGAPRYCTFVQPAHPLVAEVFPPASRRGDPVAAALAALGRECAYRSRPGRRSFDQLLAARRAGEARLEINCIDLVCLLVSCLRAAGAGDDRAWVALAGVRGFVHHHAWALVRRGERFLWIDPAVLEPVERAGGEILAGHDLYVVFNDRRLYFTAGEKRSLLGAGGPP